MIKWDSVLINGEKITITVNGFKYHGEICGNFYWMRNHEKSCKVLFGDVNNPIRRQIQDTFKVDSGCFPTSRNPKQFVKDYFTMNNTGKGKFININDEF